MFVHVVCFRWNRTLDDRDLRLIESALVALREAVPQMIDYRFGPDMGLAGAKNWDYAIVAKFADEADWRIYDSHPEHDRVRAEVFKSIIAERAAVQFSV